jgi:hypothetical protein
MAMEGMQMRNSLMLATLLSSAAWKSPFVIYRSYVLPQPGTPPGRKPGAIVFGSDQGMCGLNDVVVAHATRAPSRLAVCPEDQATRQSSIASELLDVVSGFEALKGKERY